MEQLIQSCKTVLAGLPAIIKAMRRQDFDQAMRKTAALNRNMTAFTEALDKEAELLAEMGISIDMNVLLAILSELYEAQKQRDYILQADLYELKLLPFLLAVQEAFMAAAGAVPQYRHETYDEEFMRISRDYPDIASKLRRERAPQRLLESRFSVEYTSIGAVTLSAAKLKEDGSFYFHSNYNPIQEAQEWAEGYYNADSEHYIVFGAGFGYHIEALSELDDTVQIDIYETDLQILQLAAAFGRLGGLLQKETVKLHYDPDLEHLFRAMTTDPKAVLAVHFPSLQNTSNVINRNKLEDYFLQLQAVRSQLSVLNANFRKNTEIECGNLDQLKGRFKNRRLFIIAAGPSLDKNMMELKNKKEGDIILAAATVLNKLLKAGIFPDFVILSEPARRSVFQIQKYTEKWVPLIFLSTANCRYVRRHQGERYIACQSGYEHAEKYAERKGWSLIPTGGSVATAAFGTGVTMGCSEIVFVGLDLAYTDNWRHAEELAGREVVETEGLRETVDIYGKPVKTGRNLESFKAWIEMEIKSNRQLRVIDASEGGVRIAGTELMTLKDVLKNDSYLKGAE